MKRIYVCIGIVVLLLAAAFYSSFRVQQFAEDISDDIDTAMEDIRNSDLTGARQALAEGAELCDTMREGVFSFPTILCVVRSYLRHRQTDRCHNIVFLSSGMRQ